MDHKVSKDMISSGMIPSGEKTQADLGRTQYGSAPSPSKLMDAYKSMYDKKDEVINEHHKKDADGNTIPHEGEELNEFVVTGTLATLGKLGAMAGKLGAAAAKTGVKVGAKVGGKAGANLMKSVARNPMGAIDNINRVGYAAQTVGNLMPKPRVPAVTKKQSQGGMISADADLFDIVKGQLLDEGYSEKEVNEIMVNLTEEQLEEFITAFTKKIATSAAKYGSSLGGKTPAAKMGPARPDAKPGQTGFKASSPSEVIADVNARKAAKANVLRDKMDSAVSQIRSGSLKFGSTSQEKPKQKEKPKQTVDKRPPLQGPTTSITAPPIRRNRSKEIMQDNADLFDIVKGQLLDEGLNEEEIKDIMLTLTPDEIMEELSDIVKRNDAINKANAMKAAQDRKEKSTPPKEVTDAAKRQYKAGSPGAEPYTTADKKTIINYNKNK